MVATPANPRRERYAPDPVAIALLIGCVLLFTVIVALTWQSAP